MDEIEWWDFETRDELATQAAGDVGFVVESAIEAHGSARIAFSPFGLPAGFLEALAASRAIDWSKVTLMPTHDRLVPLDADGSGQARLASLFGGKGATIISLVDEAALGDYREAGRLADERLGLIDWPLDLALLASDAGGHVAGILPGPDFDRAIAGPRERRAIGLKGEDGEGITLTAAALTGARAIMFVVEGAERRDALEQAIKDGPLSTRSAGRIVADVEAGIDILYCA